MVHLLLKWLIAKEWQTTDAEGLFVGAFYTCVHPPNYLTKLLIAYPTDWGYTVH
jgi:hypothetical protein